MSGFRVCKKVCKWLNASSAKLVIWIIGVFNALKSIQSNLHTPWSQHHQLCNWCNYFRNFSAQNAATTVKYFILSTVDTENQISKKLKKSVTLKNHQINFSVNREKIAVFCFFLSQKYTISEKLKISDNHFEKQPNQFFQKK